MNVAYEKPVMLDSPPRGGGSAAFIPRALIYRTDGDYQHNVPITVGPDGNIISFPAPTDLRYTSPVPVADGWLLDRRGVGERTRFTRYTYAQYETLATPPTLEQLRQAIIPGARVTQAYSLPMTNSEAANDTAAVNTLIRQGLPGCTQVIDMPRVMVDPSELEED